MWYTIIDRDENIIEVFENRLNLLIHIKGKFRVCYWGEDFYRPGVDNLVYANKLLRNCCHNWNDKHREHPRYGTGWVFIGFESYDYMIKDAYGRVQSIRDLAIDAWNTKIPEKKDIWWGRWWCDLPDGLPWWDDESTWRLVGRRCKHIDWQPPKRRGYNQEKRSGYDPELRPYIRGKRRPVSLMMHKSRGNHHRKHQVTWKQRKLKKQYLEKIIYGNR